jgi:hypothetical protein
MNQMVTSCEVPVGLASWNRSDRTNPISLRKRIPTNEHRSKHPIWSRQCEPEAARSYCAIESKCIKNWLFILMRNCFLFIQWIKSSVGIPVLLRANRKPAVVTPAQLIHFKFLFQNLLQFILRRKESYNKLTPLQYNIAALEATEQQTPSLQRRLKFAMGGRCN